MDPGRLMVIPVGGLRHLAPEVARGKLRAMVAGAATVRSELGLPARGGTGPGVPPDGAAPVPGDTKSQIPGEGNG